MRDNIMYYPAIVLLIVESAAASFLIWHGSTKKGDVTMTKFQDEIIMAYTAGRTS